MQLTLAFGLVFISMIVVAHGTTRPTIRPGSSSTTLRPTSRTDILPPWICRLPAICTRASPRVCGRNPQGQCERYNNICDLLNSNRRQINVGVVHVRDSECRGVRGVGGANRRPCHPICPARPVVCRRTPVSQEICVRTRDNRECKILANKCQLRNQNCQSKPRNNWLRTDRRRCGKLNLGDKPQRCLQVPSTRPTRRPTPTPTRTPTPTLTPTPTPTRTPVTPRTATPTPVTPRTGTRTPVTPRPVTPSRTPTATATAIPTVTIAA